VRGMSEGARLIYSAARQLVYAAGAISLGMAALQLSLAGRDRTATWCLIGCGVMASMFVLAAVVHRPKR